MVLLLFLAFAGSCRQQQPSPPQLDQPVKSPKVIRLFNGSDLGGFYTFLQGSGRDNDPDKVFSVVDSMIRISGRYSGSLTTRQEYENYYLVAEYKWGSTTFEPRLDSARHSGIWVNCIGEDGAFSNACMHGIEIDVMEGGTGNLLVAGDNTDNFSLTCQVSGRKIDDSFVYAPDGEPVTIHKGRVYWWGWDRNWQDVKGFRGFRNIENPRGQWNRLDCIVSGQEIKVILNGTLVNDCVNVQPRKGRLQLQSDGAEIFFRRLDLYEF